MGIEDFLRLPPSLQTSRRDKGLSQGAAAAGAGISQSGLCALERGRKVASAQALQRIAAAWQLEPAEQEELNWAREHDDLLRVVAQKRYCKAAEAFSELAQLVEELSPVECQAVAAQLRQARESTLQSRKWTRAPAPRPEVPMT